MTDYIKREDAIEAFDPQQRRDWYTPWIVETLEDLPSADVAPVRHGRWSVDRAIGAFKIFVCSECGIRMESPWGFCPNCGARMDGQLEKERME